MIRSLYTLNRNMNILQKKQENTSANMSNVNTTGYKFQNIIQSTIEEKTLMNYSDGADMDKRQDLGTIPFGNQIDGVYTDFTQGNFVETGKNTDLAINGNGFFAVVLDSGEIALTRNGNFKINENNQLTTIEGYPVLGVDANGEMSNINITLDELNVSSTGEILGNNLEIMIVDVANMDGLEKIGDSLYIPSGENLVRVQANVSQQYLESSNVNIVDEMVKMIEISREFESNQKLLHSVNETLNKAVNEIGKV